MRTLRRKREICIGMTASLSGKYSAQGSQALAGAEAWIEDTNRSGGIWVNKRMKLPVWLAHYDDESDAQRCEELTERLIVKDQADILLGPYSSGLALRAAAVAQRYQQVLWNHGGASDSIYEQGSDWVVGILTPATRYFQGIVEVSRDASPAARRVAIVSSAAGVFPREVASGAERYCKDQGFEVIHTYRYRPRTVDFNPILMELRGVQPDLILSVGRIEDDIRFARQLVHIGIKAAAVGLVAAPLTRFKEALGDVAEGFLGPSQWEPGIVAVPDYGPSPEEGMRSLTSQRSTAVDYPMAQAYAGCLVAQRCIEVAGSLDSLNLRQAASQLNFTTFYGRYRIDPTTGRQLGHQMSVVRWRGGEKVVVWPPEMRS